MKNGLALAASVVCGTAKNLLSKKGGRDFKGIRNTAKVNLITSIIAVGITLIFALLKGGAEFPFGAEFFVLAACFAAFTFAAQGCFIVATENGSVATASLLYAYGFLLPTVFGTAFYGEKIGALRICGVVLIVLSAFISNAGDKCEKFNAKFTIFALSASLCSGGVGIVQKIFRNSAYKEFSESFLITGFCLLAVSSVVTVFACKNKDEKPAESVKNFWLCASALGVCVGVANNINLFIAGALKSAVAFPVTNGGTIALSTVGSAVFYKEKLTAKKVVGVILGVAAIIMIAAEV